MIFMNVNSTNSNPNVKLFRENKMKHPNLYKEGQKGPKVSVGNDKKYVVLKLNLNFDRLQQYDLYKPSTQYDN